MTAAAKVSAVIPVYNGAAYVAEGIRSALNQTRPPIECLVIDDGSTDATADIVRQFGDEVVYVRQDRGGVSAARNRGAKLARGELVGFLDHDDVWLPAKLERQVDALGRQDAAMALCGMRVVDDGGSALGTRRLQARDDLLTGMLMFDGTETVSCSSTGLVRRAAFLAIGGFDPNLSVSADWDLLLRTLLGGPVAYVDEPLVAYRVHDANMSRNVGAMERDMIHAFAKAFADERLPASLRARERRAYGRLYRMLAGSYRDSGEGKAALRALAISLRHDPLIALELVRRIAHSGRNQIRLATCS
jgi:glycosyltransferase involved in cell wall biosynthesis